MLQSRTSDAYFDSMEHAAMIRPLTLALGLLCATTGALADDLAVRLDGTRFVKGGASWDEILGWADAKFALEKARGQLMAPVLRAREATLKTLARPLGKPFPLTTRIGATRARFESGGSATVIQLGDSPRFAQLQPGRRSALVVDIGFKKATIARMGGTPIELVPAKAKARTLFGHECTPYDIRGNGRGRAYIAPLPAEQAKALEAFAAAVVRDLGRCHGSLLLTVAARHGGVPVLAKLDGVKGMTLTGNETGVPLVVAYHRVERVALKAADVAVPGGYAVQRIPPR